MKNKIAYFLIIICITIFASYAFAKANEDLQTVVKSNSRFSFDLYKQLKEKEGNLFFSPYSISTALVMTYAGARGQTKNEMAEVLHFSLEEGLLHSSFSRLQSELNAIQGKGYVKLSIANSLWAQEGYHFLDNFLDLNNKYYGAGIFSVDYKGQSESARNKINTWVEKETQEKIKELIKKGGLTPLTRLVLCNAIYFKGNWLTQFDKKRTIEAMFYTSPNKPINVLIMSQNLKIKFKEMNSFSTIELPYEGNNLSMIVFLPKEINGLAGIEKDLTYDNVNNWIDELSSSDESEIFVSLPKFKTTCEFELSTNLKKMGIPSAFSLPPADFSGMTGAKELFISEVIHKAFVDVNEEGTEAAAATAVVMKRLSISKPLTFRADHPFIFLIRENKTKSILFLGRIVDPTK